MPRGDMQFPWIPGTLDGYFVPYQGASILNSSGALVPASNSAANAAGINATEPWAGIFEADFPPNTPAGTYAYHFYQRKGSSNDVTVDTRLSQSAGSADFNGSSVIGVGDIVNGSNQVTASNAVQRNINVVES